MARSQAPRKRHRPRPADPLAAWRTMKGTHLLASAEVERMRHIVARAIAEFASGRDCARYWIDLADTFNVAESLCDQGLASDAESRATIAHAQRVLADVHARHQLRDSWTLHAAELEALRLAAFIHHVQLQHATHADFERAYQLTVERIRQARAGNAAPGTIVVTGKVAP